MNDVVHASDLTERDKRLLFWASFLSLAAAGFGFSFRVALGGVYGEEFDLTNQQIGQIFGAALWPIAITMIGFSLLWHFVFVAVYMLAGVACLHRVLEDLDRESSG